MKKSIIFLAASLALVFSFSLGILAQQTAGAIQCTVTDQSGAVIPGASVTVTGVTVGYNRTVQTDKDGLYQLTQVPVGMYKVSIAPVQGFPAQTKETVQLSLNSNSLIDFTMTAQATATVDVTGEGTVIDP